MIQVHQLELHNRDNSRRKLDQRSNGVEILMDFVEPYDNFAFHSKCDGETLQGLETLSNGYNQCFQTARLFFLILTNIC